MLLCMTFLEKSFTFPSLLEAFLGGPCVWGAEHQYLTSTFLVPLRLISLMLFGQGMQCLHQQDLITQLNDLGAQDNGSNLACFEDPQESLNNNAQRGIPCLVVWFSFHTERVYNYLYSRVCIMLLSLMSFSSTHFMLQMDFPFTKAV